MIIQMANGWTDHCSEGPCDLYCKGMWSVWKSPEMKEWLVDFDDELVTRFSSLDLARGYVDLKGVPDVQTR